MDLSWAKVGQILDFPKMSGQSLDIHWTWTYFGQTLDKPRTNSGRCVHRLSNPPSYRSTDVLNEVKFRIYLLSMHGLEHPEVSKRPNTQMDVLLRRRRFSSFGLTECEQMPIPVRWMATRIGDETAKYGCPREIFLK